MIGPEVVPGYPDRLIPKPEHAAELKKRTLTNLYNQRPAWLVNAHRALDEAVAAAYGWPTDLSDDEVLRRLLALNRGTRPGEFTTATTLPGEMTCTSKPNWTKFTPNACCTYSRSCKSRW